MSDPPALVLHLNPYDSAHRGSFVPMIEAARVATVGQGWRFAAVFPAAASGRSWYAELVDGGMDVRPAPALGRAAMTGWIHGQMRATSGPVLLHTHFSLWDLPAALAALRHGHARLVWHLHTRLSDVPAVRARNLVRFGVIGRSVDRLLCVGPEVQAKALARLAPAKRTILFPNGVDVNAFSAAADGGAQARHDLGLPADTPLLLAYAWDWETKGGELLLQAVARLRRRGRDVHALVVGSPDIARSRAGALGIADAIATSGPLPDARPLLAACDVFVAPSIAEGLPFSVLEALSSGRPVVASDIPSHRLIAATVPGCELAPRIPDALADVLASVLDRDESESRRLAIAGRVAIVRDYSLDHWASSLTGIYRELLAAPPSTGP